MIYFIGGQLLYSSQNLNVINPLLIHKNILFEVVSIILKKSFSLSRRGFFVDMLKIFNNWK